MTGEWSKKTIQRVSYTAIFLLVAAVVATSYIGADADTQVSLPGAKSGDSINVNLMQGQKADQWSQANAVAASVSTTTGGELAGGVSAQGVAAQTTTADDVKAANVASSVASVVNLSSSNSVSSSAESANVIAEMAQADATSASKAQIVSPTSESKAITQYTVQEGDNVDSVAGQFDVTSQTVRWANGLKDGNLTPGAVLNIPTVDGVLYTFKDGDTLAAVADKYKSNVESIITINNLHGDAQTVPTGTVILLPDGILPETERPEYVAPAPVRTTNRLSGYGRAGAGTRGLSSSLRVRGYGGNRYAYGNCTYYAYDRRAQLGKPLPAVTWGNANTWATNARRYGYLVNSTPSVGAVFQTRAGYYGHVGIVEEVYADGSIRISEMNYAGFNRVTEGYMSPSDYAGYNFIH